MNKTSKLKEIEKNRKELESAMNTDMNNYLIFMTQFKDGSELLIPETDRELINGMVCKRKRDEIQMQKILDEKAELTTDKVDYIKENKQVNDLVVKATKHLEIAIKHYGEASNRGHVHSKLILAGLEESFNSVERMAQVLSMPANDDTIIAKEEIM